MAKERLDFTQKRKIAEQVKNWRRERQTMTPGSFAEYVGSVRDFTVRATGVGRPDNASYKVNVFYQPDSGVQVEIPSMFGEDGERQLFESIETAYLNSVRNAKRIGIAKAISYADALIKKSR